MQAFLYRQVHDTAACQNHQKNLRYVQLTVEVVGEKFAEI